MDEAPGQESPPTEDPSKRKDYKALLEKVTTRDSTLHDKWRKAALETQKKYLGDDDCTPFNILYSNTETIVPATFSQKPTARVLRRFDESRADVPAKAVQRMLTFCMDTNLPSLPNFMTTVEASVLDAAVPGQGLFRVRLVNQLAVLDLVQWDMFIWGYCRRWEDCPWQAFAHDMTPADIIKEFNLEGVDAQKVKSHSSDEPTDNDKTTNEKRPATLKVYETWVKGTREVLWLCDAIEGCCLGVDDDLLKLDNFFPTPPKPLNFVQSTTDTLPRPLYQLYADQAEELNEITRRLRKIISALRVRGVYASNIPDIPKIFEEGDNILIPSEAASQVLLDGKGLESKIWMLPIDKLVLVAKELYGAREAVKGVIYEILGIGDILRGVSKASETLGAQQLKDKWGSLRINKARERTASFICDGLRLLSEVSVKHTPPEMWEKITGMQLAPPVEAGSLQQSNQPLKPMQTWQGVLGVLQNDLSRAYLIDVETNSTVDSEATTDKAETIEFMNAFGQAMSGLEKLMMSSPEGFTAGKAVLLGVTNKFKLGEEVAPLLEALQPPQQGQSEETKKAMADIQKQAAELQKREQALVADEALLKDMLGQAQDATKETKAAQDDLQRKREDLRREQDAMLEKIEMAKERAILEIDKAGVKLDSKKAAVQAAKMQAAATARPRPAGAA